ncbi:hypothetical protein CRE_10984 [Caenorhabditis remanei]|uniref:Uncharacterized protein n=2 Tax=Caenorhabditis remanei TaxID=31234 RepID=E3M5V3_CAERE|nr:hypothetical protein CRE_10984 [Caenorhabditis remanei]
MIMFMLMILGSDGSPKKNMAYLPMILVGVMIYRFLNIGMMSKKKRRDIPYYAGYLKIVLLGSMTFSLVLMPMTYYLDLSVPSHYQLYKYIIYAFVIFLGYFTWNVVDACELQYSWAYSVLLPCLAVFHYYLPNYMEVTGSPSPLIFIWNFLASFFDYVLLEMEQLQPSSILGDNESPPKRVSRLMEPNFRRLNFR